MIQHIWEIVIATIVSFIIGSFWYSPLLFIKPWLRGASISEKDMKLRASVIIFWLISTFVLTYALNVFVQFANATTYTQAILVAIYTWAGFIATAMIGSVLWEKKPISFYLINVGYYLVAMVVSSVIFVLV